MDNIFTVKEVTEQVTAALKNKLSFLWVQGEVTNLKFAKSGHIYFDLQEDNDHLRCVWFRGKQRPLTHDPLTGEVWEDGTILDSVADLANGRVFICAGTIEIYSNQSSYQLIVDFALSAGIGILYREFERLKAKLEKNGFFDPNHKKAIPLSPTRVAVITAPTGAAVQDFLRIAEERGTGATIRIYPVPVQGAEAIPCIVSAFKQIEKENWTQLIVLIRGGGSMTDLWVFNDEKIAQAIYKSPIPVLTGIGHEIDHSIADFVADRSAATPSHTAQLLWKEKKIIAAELDQWEFTLSEKIKKLFLRHSQNFSHYLHALILVSPLKKLCRKEEKLDILSEKLQNSFLYHIRKFNTTLEACSITLAHLSEFTAARSESLNILENNLKKLSNFTRKKAEFINLLEMKLNNCMEKQCIRFYHTLEPIIYKFNYLKNNIGEKEVNLLNQLEITLKSLDPYAPVRRGYALLADENGKMLRFTNDIFQGKILKVILKEDVLTVTVNSIKHKQMD